jgi:hypothetical protein
MPVAGSGEEIPNPAQAAEDHPIERIKTVAMFRSSPKAICAKKTANISKTTPGAVNPMSRYRYSPEVCWSGVRSNRR